MSENVIISIWILSAIYCLYKLYQRAKATSLDGVTGYTPGLEAVSYTHLTLPTTPYV